ISGGKVAGGREATAIFWLKTFQRKITRFPEVTQKFAGLLKTGTAQFDQKGVCIKIYTMMITQCGQINEWQRPDTRQSLNSLRVKVQFFRKHRFIVFRNTDSLNLQGISQVK